MNEFSDNHNIHFQNVINHPDLPQSGKHFLSQNVHFYMCNQISMLQKKTFNVLSSLLFSDNHTMYSDEEEEEEEEEETEEEFAEVKHWKKNSNMDS